jgi:hypothetical protein
MFNTQKEYDGYVDHITDLLESAGKGNYIAQAKLKEAISTSDFPAVFTDIKNAQLQAKYALVTDHFWQKLARKVTVPNFLPQSFIDLGWDDTAFDNILATNGGRKTIAGGLPNVPEGTEYPTAFKLYSSSEQLEIRKAGARIPFTFEAIINDQWNIVNDLPGWLLRTALDSEDIEVTQLLSDGDGINSAYFNAQNNNLVTFGTNAPGTVALTRDTLKAALKQANSHKTGPGNNRPVKFNKFAVVVSSAMYEDVLDIVNGPKQFIITDGGLETVGTFEFGVAFEVVENPWLDVVDGTHAATAWYVVPFGGEGVRTALGLGFLLGHENPELRVHNESGLYLGGGIVPQSEGSFLNDTWQLRIRHIYGGVALNGGIGTAASNGTAAPTV